MHGSLISKVRELIPHSIIYFRGEGRVMIVGAGADPALVKHSIKGDLVHAFFKQRFGWSCTTALIKHSRYFLFAIFYLSAQSNRTFPDTVSMLFNHCKLLTECSQVLLLLGLFMRINCVLWLQMCEYPPISRSVLELLMFLVILDKMPLEWNITRFIKRVLKWLVYLSYRVILATHWLQNMIWLSKWLQDFARTT